jgi:predicted metal-dependent phosphoesterase TrpH
VRLAAEAGLSAIALTDHDTLEGIAEANEEAAAAGIELIPGTELSLAWSRGGMHLVVLFLTPGRGHLQDRLGTLQEGRSQRNARMVSRLGELGFDISPEELAAEAGGGQAGRPHIAAIMVRKGYVADITAAFEQWLAAGRPAYLERDRLSPEEAISLARMEGGVPILAHPHTLGLDNAGEVETLLERLTAAGLIGLESYCSAYSSEEADGYAKLARRFGLIPSGGSDYHGTYKAGIALGAGKGDLVVSDSVLKELRAATP